MGAGLAAVTQPIEVRSPQYHKKAEPHPCRWHYPRAQHSQARPTLRNDDFGDLSWNPNVDATTKKTNTSMTFIRRTQSSCPWEIKAQVYKNLVIPTLEYASTVWDPLIKVFIQHLGAVQQTAACFVR